MLNNLLKLIKPENGHQHTNVGSSDPNAIFTTQFCPQSRKKIKIHSLRIDFYIFFELKYLLNIFAEWLLYVRNMKKTHSVPRQSPIFPYILMSVTPKSISIVLIKFSNLIDSSSFMVYKLFQFAMSGIELSTFSYK